MEKLAEAIKLAAKIREDSFDWKAAKEAEKKSKYVDYNKFYKKSIYDAADKAAEIIGFDKRGSKPIYLLLSCCWNDILDWTEQFKKGE